MISLTWLPVSQICVHNHAGEPCTCTSYGCEAMSGRALAASGPCGCRFEDRKASMARLAPNCGGPAQKRISTGTHVRKLNMQGARELGGDNLHLHTTGPKSGTSHNTDHAPVYTSPDTNKNHRCTADHQTRLALFAVEALSIQQVGTCGVKVVEQHVVI